MKNTTIGSRIKARRKDLGLTQTELAERMGYKTKAAISSVENNNEDLTTERVKKYAEALNTTPSFLMGWVDDKGMPISSCNTPQVIRIPIYESVAAGDPILMNPEASTFAVIPEDWTRGSELFGVRVRGDSMEPLIHNDDVVVVKKQSNANTGDIVIVSIGNEIATCKKLEKNDDGITLVPINSIGHEAKHYSSKDIEREQIQIIGKVKVSITNF